MPADSTATTAEIPPKPEGEDLIDKKISEAVKLTPNQSLFDNHTASNLESNLLYMTNAYGFFLPEIEFVTDVEGLVKYLGEKLSIGNTCIWCEKAFYTLEAVQAHMRDKSHCKIRWDDNENEYSDFYDLDTADKRFAVWDDEEIEVDEGRTGGKPEKEKESEPETRIRVNDQHQLVVSSSGASDEKVVGHRALKVFYKQRPRHQNTNYQLITSLMQEHKRLAAIQHQQRTNQDNTYHQKQTQIYLAVGIAGNKQKHYRNQNPL